MPGQRFAPHTHGRSLVYPNFRSSSSRQVSNIFDTLGHVAGADLNDYGAGGTARIAEGPLSEIWTLA